MKKNLAVFVLALAIVAAAGCTDKNTPEPVEDIMLLHPAFSITLSDLEAITIGLEPEIRTNILARPGHFLTLMEEMLQLPPEVLVLVDKEHPLSTEFVPQDLVSLNDYNITVNRNDLSLREWIMPDTLRMMEAARKEGIKLVFSSCYRSYEYQAKVYQRNVDRYGKETADRESAQPGKSQHQLGVTIDFGSITDAFGGTPAGMWLFRNGWKYGFSLSYPDGYEHLTGYRHEIWHYRYITPKGTEMEKTFFSSIQQYFLEFFHNHGDYFREKQIPIEDKQ
ncbi:MAG: M15 family metallopeptidase [Spirochaetales bacterium]|nr:M15 family metallopeptidase [Spirochaetales bacterium]